MRADAERGKFQAIMFWKFDRLARSHEHAVMIKMLLRQEYELKLYCVEGFSEDDDRLARHGDDGTDAGRLFCILLAQSQHRNQAWKAPSGAPWRVQWQCATTRLRPGHRCAGNPRTACGVICQSSVSCHRAARFRLHATGDYSDSEIADWMKTKKEIKRLRAGKQPINKEMVRDMLKNSRSIPGGCVIATRSTAAAWVKAAFGTESQGVV